MTELRRCESQYTLVACANTPQENPWVITTVAPSYITHDVAEYRGKPVATRKKLPVVETVGVRVSLVEYGCMTDATVVTTDGVPDWSTLKVKS